MLTIVIKIAWTMQPLPDNCINFIFSVLNYQLVTTSKKKKLKREISLGIIYSHYAWSAPSLAGFQPSIEYKRASKIDYSYHLSH